ncbi:MAG: RNA methyltransferase [Clostridia bacterium]|nr:RNA methyltransferase [Clostridia bacterium]
MIIKSTQNQNVKFLRKLIKDKSFRNDNGLFVCEGKRLIESIPNSFKIHSIYIREDKENEYINFINKYQSYVLDKDIFNGIADTKNPSGIMAIVYQQIISLDNLQDGPFLLLDNILDPGNLGTILRSAAAIDIKNVILYNCTDLYSPKVVRSSMSGLFFLNIYQLDLNNTLKIIKNKNLISLDLKGENIYNYTLKENDCLCVGNEAFGLSPEIRERTNMYLTIPMKNVESLNAAISVSIAMFILKK